MIFDGSGGRSWHHFPLFLGCQFRDLFLIVLKSVLGTILELFGLPNGVYVEGFGGSDLGLILGWFLGGVWDPLKFRVQQKWKAIGGWRGSLTVTTDDRRITTDDNNRRQTETRDQNQLSQPGGPKGPADLQ